MASDMDDDEDLEEVEETYIEQVIEAVCPHCQGAIQVSIAPAASDEDDDIEDL